MLCPFCRAGFKFIRTYETIRHRNMTERRKLCENCGSAWKTVEQKTDPIAEAGSGSELSNLKHLEQNEMQSGNEFDNDVPFPEVMHRTEKPNYLKIRKALEAEIKLSAQEPF